MHFNSIENPSEVQYNEDTVNGGEVCGVNVTVNGFLMARDTPVAEITNNEIRLLNPKLAPLHFTVKHGTLETWLKERAVDTRRENSRLLRKALRLSDKPAEELTLAVNAASITDVYWIKEKDSPLTYADVCFEANDFANVALTGSFSAYNKPYSRTPELTNTGSFEKCWRKEDGVWWLYKAGDMENLFSEMAAYRLAVHFGYDTAHYEIVCCPDDERAHRGKGIIRTRDFTQGAAVNFEPAASLGLRTDDISYNYKTLQTISPKLADQYFDIVTLDTLVYNLDRHTQNFGVLRDVDTGEILSLAPNYDNNVSLLCGIHGVQERTTANDALFREWKVFVQSNLIAKPLPELTQVELQDILAGIGCGAAPEDIARAEQFILAGYEMMQEAMEQVLRLTGGKQDFGINESSLKRYDSI